MGPYTHPQGAEIGCAMFSVTRNSICTQWANSSRSEDTRKTAKDTWSEGKGRTQRLGAATACVLRGTAMPGLLLHVDKPQGSAQANRLDSDLEMWELFYAVAGIHWGVESLTKTRDFMGRMPRWGLQPCPVAPFETVFSLPSHFLNVKAGRLHLPLQGLQGQACQYSAEWKVPPGDQFCFSSVRWALLIWN